MKIQCNYNKGDGETLLDVKAMEGLKLLKLVFWKQQQELTPRDQRGGKLL
jgi:hypothetical protein